MYIAPIMASASAIFNRLLIWLESFVYQKFIYLAIINALVSEAFSSFVETEFVFLPWFVAGATLFVYNLDRILKCRDKVTRRQHLPFVIIGGLVSFSGLFLIPFQSLLLLSLLFILSLSYTVSIRKAGKGLRAFPLIKNLLIAVVYALALPLLPYLISFEQNSITQPIISWPWHKFLAFGILVLGISFIFDGLDREKDQNSGLCTFSSRLPSAESAFNLGAFLGLISILIVGISFNALIFFGSHLLLVWNLLLSWKKNTVAKKILADAIMLTFALVSF